jgi:hypothetical protein
MRGIRVGCAWDTRGMYDQCARVSARGAADARVPGGAFRSSRVASEGWTREQCCPRDDGTNASRETPCPGIRRAIHAQTSMFDIKSQSAGHIELPRRETPSYRKGHVDRLGNVTAASPHGARHRSTPTDIESRHAPSEQSQRSSSRTYAIDNGVTTAMSRSIFSVKFVLLGRVEPIQSQLRPYTYLGRREYLRTTQYST